MTRKDRLTLKLFAAVQDLAGALLYYDRKEDEDLSREDLAEMLQKGWTDAEEIEGWFAEALENGIAGMVGGVPQTSPERIEK